MAGPVGSLNYNPGNDLINRLNTGRFNKLVTEYQLMSPGQRQAEMQMLRLKLETIRLNKNPSFQKAEINLENRIRLLNEIIHGEPLTPFNP
jgi:hypothetical protein